MKKNAPTLSRIVAATRTTPVIPARVLARLAIHPQEISRLLERGEIVRLGRGRYTLPTADLSEDLGLALAAAAAPRTVVCLLSALRFHQIGTQAPAQVWVAVERGTARPRVAYPPLRVSVFAGTAFRFGIERHTLDGVSVRIYSAAKTVADCFKYRNKIGLDVALEALREGLRERRFTRDALWSAAKICRVNAVIRPYLEAL
jgi:predicted transcriptional regulator of viral defense system